MDTDGRKGMSLTYKFVLIILVLTLFPAMLMAFSSFSTFTDIEQTVESAMEDIKATAVSQTATTKKTAINRTKNTLIDVLKTNLRKKRDNKIEKYSQTLSSVQMEAETTASYIERSWEHLDSDSFNPVFEGMVWAGPMNDEERAANREQVNRLSHIGVFLEHMDRGNNHTSLTYFGTQDNNVVTSRNITTVLNGIPSGFSNVERPWYVRVNETGKTEWTNTYVDANTHELVTTVAAPVHRNDELFGVVGFDVTLGVLSNDILETDPGFAFLLDDTGEAIVYPGMRAPNKTVYAQRTFNGTNFLEDNVSSDLQAVAEDMVAGKEGIRKVTIEGKESYVAYGPLEASDWSVGVAVPVEETVEPVTAIEADLGNQMDALNEKIESKTGTVQASLDSAIKTTTYRYFLLFMLIIFMVAALGVYISGKITKPIIRLHEKAESISKGGIEEEVHVSTGDEIEELADSFNRIMRTIKILQQRDAPDPDIQGVNADTGSDDDTDTVTADEAADDAGEPDEDQQPAQVTETEQKTAESDDDTGEITATEDTADAAEESAEHVQTAGEITAAAEQDDSQAADETGEDRQDDAEDFWEEER